MQSPRISIFDYALACAHEGEKIAHHNTLQDYLFETASQASWGPTKEEAALIIISGTNSRQADVFVHNLFEGDNAAFDRTIVSH